MFEEKFVRNGNRSAASDQNIASPHSYSVNNLNQYTAISGKNLSYYANGNQTTSPQDAGASLKYDWNDRLIQVNATSSTKAQPATSGLAWDEIRYVYDPLGRRLAKTVTGNGAFKRATRFIYDRWNVVEERTERQGAPGISKFLFWGEDLSGSLQGAGGVGGLLTQMEKTDTSNWSASYYHYDGNGNVATVSGPFRAILAKFSYDGFGRTVTQTGAKSGIDITAIPYRFSTKPMELELATANTTLVPPPVSSGLYYYGYRFYSPNMGRWINRDPIREKGGRNLYNFVGNDGVDKWDKLGNKELTFAYITSIDTARVEFLGFYFNGGMKSAQTVSVDSDTCEITFESKHTRKTILYESATSYNEIASAQANGSSIKSSAKKTGACLCELKMEGNESDPLIPLFAPGVTYHVIISINSKSKKYDWSVKHDPYPSHKLTAHDGSFLENYSHITAGTSPTDLYSENVSNGGSKSW